MLTCNFLERFCRDSTSFSGPENRRNNLTYLKLLVCDLTSEQQSFVGWLKNNFVPLPDLNGKAPRAHRFMSCVGFFFFFFDNIKIVVSQRNTRGKEQANLYAHICANLLCVWAVDHQTATGASASWQIKSTTMLHKKTIASTCSRNTTN